MTQIDPAALPDDDPADALSKEQVQQLLALLSAGSTAMATPAPADPPAASDAQPTNDENVQQAPAAITTDADAAASSPAADPTATDPAATEPAPASSVSEPSPPAGTLVCQSFTPPGQEHPTVRYGIVVAVDEATNTAQVSWFLADPTTVDGNAIAKVS